MCVYIMCALVVEYDECVCVCVCVSMTEAVTRVTTTDLYYVTHYRKNIILKCCLCIDSDDDCTRCVDREL